MHRLPHDLEDFTKNINQLLRTFHAVIENHVTTNGTGITSMVVLNDQIQRHTHAFQDLTQQLVQIIGERQRDANRQFTPVIALQLLSAYEYCTAERGM